MTRRGMVLATSGIYLLLAGILAHICTESVPRQEEGSTGKYQHEVEVVPEGAARGNSRDRMLVFSCIPQVKSRYGHNPIYKSDEALAIAIAIAMSRAIAMSKPRAKKKTD